MRDFMAQHALNFAAAHSLEQPLKRPPRPRLGRAGGKGVDFRRLVDANLRQTGQPGTAGQLMDVSTRLRSTAFAPTAMLT